MVNVNLKYRKKVVPQSFRRNSFNINMMLPAMIFILFVMVFPVIYSFVMSLFDWRLGKTPKFIGIENFVNIFKIPDIAHSVWITILFALVVTVLAIVFGLFLAVLLNMDLRGSNFIMAILLIPWALPPVVVGLMWKWIFNPRLGTFNNILIAMGLLGNFREWQSEPWPAFIIIVVTTVYKVLPLTVFLLSASLKTIPKELYEAADVDGMSPAGRFFSITLPLVRPSMVIVFILLSVETFKAFDLIYVLTRGGPGNFTSVLNYISYLYSFTFMKFGLGAAIAFFVSFLIVIISIFYYRLTYREVRY